MAAAEEKAQVAPSSGGGAVMAGEAAPGTTAKGSTKGTRDRITGLLLPLLHLGGCVCRRSGVTLFPFLLLDS